jgi:hypothetical protein
MQPRPLIVFDRNRRFSRSPSPRPVHLVQALPIGPLPHGQRPLYAHGSRSASPFDVSPTRDPFVGVAPVAVIDAVATSAGKMVSHNFLVPSKDPRQRPQSDRTHDQARADSANPAFRLTVINEDDIEVPPDNMSIGYIAAMLMAPSMGRGHARGNRGHRWDISPGPTHPIAWQNFTYFPCIRVDQTGHARQYHAKMFACWYASWQPADAFVGHPANWHKITIRDTGAVVTVDGALLRGESALKGLEASLSVTRPQAGSFIWFSDMTTDGAGVPVYTATPPNIQGCSFGLALAACIISAPPVAYTGYLKKVADFAKFDKAFVDTNGSVHSLQSARSARSDDVVEDIDLLPQKIMFATMANWPLVVPHKNMFGADISKFLGTPMQPKSYNANSFLAKRAMTFYSTVQQDQGLPLQTNILCATTLPEAVQLAALAMAYVLHAGQADDVLRSPPAGFTQESHQENLSFQNRKYPRKLVSDNRMHSFRPRQDADALRAQYPMPRGMRVSGVMRAGAEYDDDDEDYMAATKKTKSGIEYDDGGEEAQNFKSERRTTTSTGTGDGYARGPDGLYYY